MINPPRHFAGLILACVAVGLTMTASCKNTKLDSTWTPAPILVDGHASDWNGVTSHYLEESEASVAFANDSAQLFVLLRTRDPRLASAIRRSGLKFWVNAEGKKTENFVIRYRGGPTREEMRSVIGDNRRGQLDRESQFMMPDTGQPKLTCFVKDRIIEMEIPVDGSNGPAAAFGVYGGFFTYEFSLPLHGSVVRSYGLAAVPGQTIRFGAEWGGRERGTNHDSPGPGGMGRGTPTGAGGDFGRGGGRGGGRRGDRSENRPVPLSAQDIQMSLRLAEPTGM